MKIERVDEIIDKYEGKASSLILMLLDIQSENHWLPKEALERVSERLEVPLTRIQQITSFYKVFSLAPKGRHEIHVCTGTGCYVRGARKVIESVQDLIGIELGETDLDFKFSLDTTNCSGCCASGPVMEVDGKLHGKMSPEKTADVLKNYE